MTVLSDVTIRELIASTKIVSQGNLAAAKHCAYEFKAGRVVYGGIVPPSSQVDAVDLCSSPSRTAAIHPSGVAWVRSREMVSIPKNVVGMWVQTNSLSRRGLLLLNSTLVEPGYAGYLSAHFVNFGSSPVLLSSATTIAKLVFFQLDADAVDHVDSSKYTDYDAMIDALAAQSTRSFLRISELVPDLSKASDAAVADAKQQIVAEATQSMDKAKDELADLRKQTFLKVGGGFALGLALAVAFSIWIFPQMRSVDLESRDRITAIVAERNSDLVKQFNKLEIELKEIRSATQRASPATGQ
jgi:deoxycytidine triphosphate deaminase